jgi:hypothetical protein
MARTYRRKSYKYFREPKTRMFKKNLDDYVMTSKDYDLPFSKVNRAKSLNPPDSYDDIRVSAKNKYEYYAYSGYD